MTATALRLLAQDAEDLALISAAVQDGVVKLGDVSYAPATRTLTLAMNRYRWEAPAGTRGERVRSALQLGGVEAVRSRGLPPGARDAVVSLLALEFEPGEAPGGAVVLRFSGGGDLRAEVECLDAALADVSAPWPARAAPRHPA